MDGGAQRPGWTLEAWIEHSREIDKYKEKFEDERDRRFSEVALEREKALKIKETADETARILVAANQAYRDEKANELRSQIEGERGNYATKDDLQKAAEKIEVTTKPLGEFMASSLGRAGAGSQAWVYVIAAAGLLMTLGGMTLTVIAIIIGVVSKMM